MERVLTTMMQLIRCEITGEPLPAELSAGLSDDDLASLYRLSRTHDLAHLTGAALDAHHLLPDGAVAEQFRKAIFMAVSRYEQSNYELDRLCRVWEEAKIPFIPLKGAVLRRFYPEPWMRTSCDIDVLVREADLKKAAAAVTGQLGFTPVGRGSHDVTYTAPSGVRLELHYRLVEDYFVGQAEQPLLAVWDAVSADPGSVRYAMTDEMFYYYHVAHMAKHFVYGGCGIRPFIDLFILCRRVPHDDEKRRALLLAGGLAAFEEAAVKLAAAWFSGAETDDLTGAMQNYLLSGGIYGSAENRVAVFQHKKGGRLRYLLARVFLPYSILKHQYPVLKKHKWLLPLMQVRRWCGALRRTGFKRISDEVRINQAVPAEKQAETAVLMHRLGL